MRSRWETGQIHLGLGILACVLALLLWASEFRANAQPGIISTTPLFSPSSGYFNHPISLKIDGTPPGAQLFYTLDGRDPQLDGERYTAPLTLKEGGVAVVRASYQMADGSWGDQGYATYVIGEAGSLPRSLPVLSIIGDPAGLWDAERGLFDFPFARGIEWEREVMLMFFEGRRSEQAQQLAFASPAGLRIHGSASRSYPKQSLRLYFREAYGNGRLLSPLYEGQQQITLANFDRLVLHSGSQDYATPNPDPRSNWTLLRTALVYELAAELGVPTTQSRPTLVFVNGRSYGIYQIRTFIDETFLYDRYGFNAFDYFTISGDPGSPGALFEPTTEELPGKAAWIELMTYVENHDVTDETVYRQLETMIDMDNFIDYVILQMYVANTDWLRNNVKLFRPASTRKWTWALWDVDDAFGLAPWNNVERDMLDWLHNSERRGLEQGSLVLRTLLENETFRQRYLQRLDELLQTTLAPDKVAGQLDEMAAEMRPDIHFETDLWTSSGDWEASVAEMRDFIMRRPTLMREHHEAFFGGS
ncbi:MAG: CotH kinase family protein [Chloroflexota bacterium]